MKNKIKRIEKEISHYKGSAFDHHFSGNQVEAARHEALLEGLELALAILNEEV